MRCGGSHEQKEKKNQRYDISHLNCLPRDSNFAKETGQLQYQRRAKKMRGIAAAHFVNQVGTVLTLDLNLFLFVSEHLNLRAGLDDRLFSFFQKTKWSKQDNQRDRSARFVIARFTFG